MSSHFSNLHSYVSQRLLSLFETLAKKYHRLENELKIRQESLRDTKPHANNVNNAQEGATSQGVEAGAKAEPVSEPVVVNVNNHVEQNKSECETVISVAEEVETTSDLVSAKANRLVISLLTHPLLLKVTPMSFSFRFKTWPCLRKC